MCSGIQIKIPFRHLKMGLLHILLILTISCPAGSGLLLDNYITHYEGLSYDREQFFNNHHRVKHNTQQDNTLHLQFTAFGRNFILKLRPDSTIFSEEAKLNGVNNMRQQFDTSYLYTGILEGDKNSHIYGSVIEKIFSGYIKTGTGTTYWIEHADKYFPSSSVHFHSIIYVDNGKELLSPTEKGKGDRLSSDSIQETINDERSHYMEYANTGASDGKLNMTKNTLQVKATADNLGSNKLSIRLKRSIQNRRTCSLYLQSDTFLWDRLTKPPTENGLYYSADRARNKLIATFATHVNRLNRIFEDTVFQSYDGTHSYSGITFIVHRIGINETDRDCPNGLATENNAFCNPDLDKSSLLDLWSSKNHNDFCLAYLFTYKDFDHGHTGLSWQASSGRHSGGVCEPYREYINENGRKYQSQNTGVLSLSRYGSQVSTKMSTLAFAREVGYSFGSPSDSGDLCVPEQANSNDNYGNFLMFGGTNTGDLPNNNKFSPCSKDKITGVLDAVLNSRNGKRNCFTDRVAGFCGNMIVEEGEECDCGFDIDCKEACCYGRGSSEGTGCTIKPWAQCSPSQGPCCSHDCRLSMKWDNVECSVETDCLYNSFCDDSQGAACPEQESKLDLYSLCNGDSQVCMKGECSASLCVRIGWDQCTVDSDHCILGCKNPNATACLSTKDTYKLMKPENAPLKDLLREIKGILSWDEGVILPPGSPCNNNIGYCNQTLHCVDIDQPDVFTTQADDVITTAYPNEFDKTGASMCLEIQTGLIYIEVMLLLILRVSNF